MPLQKEDGQNLTISAYPFTFPKFYDANKVSYEEAFNEFLDSLDDDESILDQNLNFLDPKEQYKNREDKSE